MRHFALSFVLLALVAAASWAAPGSFRQVVVSDDLPLGIFEGDPNSLVIGDPVLDAVGRVAVTVRGRVGQATEWQVWREAADGVASIARTGQEYAFGEKTLSLTEIDPALQINGGGQLVFNSSCRPCGRGGRQLFSHSIDPGNDNMLELAVHDPSENFVSPFPVDPELMQLSEVGEIAYRGTGNGPRAYVARLDGTELVTGSLNNSESRLALNDLGQFAIVQREVFSNSPLEFVLFEADGARRVLASELQPINGVALGDINNIGLNNLGQVLFAHGEWPHGNTLSVIEPDGVLRTIAEIGSQFSVAGGEATLTEVYAAEPMNFNDRGQVLFRARLTGPENEQSIDRALIRYDPDTGLEVLVREGDPLPLSLPDGEQRPRRGEITLPYFQPGGFNLPTEYMTEDGAVVFASAGGGLWHRGTDGTITSVIHTSTEIPVETGGTTEARLVARFFLGRDPFSSSDAVLDDAVNDRGQIAMTILFRDQTSGVFVWTPVPEPGGILLVMVASCAVLTCRPKRGPGAPGSGERG